MGYELKIRPHVAYTLTKLNKIGPIAAKRILDYMIASEIVDLQGLDPDELIHQKVVDKDQIAPFCDLKLLALESRNAERRIAEYADRGITTISIADVRYPFQLSMTTDNPPVLLYCKGNIELLRDFRNVAIMGTRKNTTLGAELADGIVKFLVSKGYTIVSGLDLGINSVVHTSTLAEKGKTISVLADIENIIPESNKILAAQILTSEGLLVSENEPGTPPVLPGSFVQRSRIQAGLSLGVIPVETTRDGHAMRVVDSAFKNKRLVFVPDPKRSNYPSNSIPQLEGIIHLATQKSGYRFSQADYTPLLKALDRKYEKFVNHQFDLIKFLKLDDLIEGMG